MPRFVTLILSALVVSFAHANCELSWLAEWEAGKNWLHTTALRNNQTVDALNDNRFRYTLPRDQANSKVVQIEKISNTSLSVVCDSVEASSCPTITRLQHVGQGCSLRPKDLRTTATPIKEDNISEVTEDRYARLSVDNCLATPFGGNLAVLDGSGTLQVPVATRLTPTALTDGPTDQLQAFTHVANIDHLQIDIDTTVNISDKTPILKKAFVHPNNPEIYFAQFSLEIDARSIPRACGDGCADDQPPLHLPLIVAQLRPDAPTLFGNGYRGQCAGSWDGYNQTLAQHLSYDFGLPSEYIVYDLENDGVIDYLQITPRDHLPGTQYVYRVLTANKQRVPTTEEQTSLGAEQQATQHNTALNSTDKATALTTLDERTPSSLNDDKQTVFFYEKEICVDGPEGCRPGAGC